MLCWLFMKVITPPTHVKIDIFHIFLNMFFLKRTEVYTLCYTGCAILHMGLDFVSFCEQSAHAKKYNFMY